MQITNKFKFSLIASCVTLSSCAGAVLNYTPINTLNGKSGYSIYTVYGGIDGSKKAASEVLDREAGRLCNNKFVVIKEEEHARRTRWGAKNGQIDYIKQVQCM